MKSPLPELEDDLPADMRSAMSGLALSSDAELWQIANSMMSEEKQSRFESLIAESKFRAPTEAAEFELNNLVNEAQQLVLRKAEAYWLLARRGHIVFS